MSFAAVILFVVKASLALTVFAVGLDARSGDAAYLIRHRALFARSIIAMNVIMPAIAISMATIFPLYPAVKLALVTLAVSPVPPFLPGKVAKSGGDGAYTVSLLVVASVLAIVVIPVTLEVFGLFTAAPLAAPFGKIASIVGFGILLPLALGIVVQRVSPAMAERGAKPVTTIAMAALVIGFVLILVKSWPAMLSLIGNGSILAIIAITLIGLAVGHALGGPKRDDRTVLALATATRHPAIAIAIAAASFPDQKLTGAAVMLSLIAVALASLPYVQLSKRAMRGVVSPTAASRTRAPAATARPATASRPRRRSTDVEPRAAAPPTRRDE